jgi:hypothetical protein
MLLLGAAIIMASIVWELARMNPATPYLVEPWSLRGYESVHGSVTFTIGALLFLAGLLTIWERSKEPMISRIVAIMMGAGAIGIAAIYGTDEKTMGGGFLGWVIAVLAGYVAQAAIVPLLPKMSRVAQLGISVLILVVTATVLSATLLGTSRSALPVVWVTIAAVVLVGIAITGVPAELAANRMLIFSTVGGGAAIALSAAASRSNLIAAQLELDGVAGKFQDTQVTSGWFVALFGILVAFVGAVSLWAKRRDIIINQQRAERQRAAAEASAAEIQAALELAQEHQRASRAAPRQG